MTISGTPPYATTAHNQEMLRQVRASRLEKRLRDVRIRRALSGFEGMRGEKAAYAGGPRAHRASGQSTLVGRTKGRLFLALRVALAGVVTFAGTAREAEERIGR